MGPWASPHPQDPEAICSRWARFHLHGGESDGGRVAVHGADHPIPGQHPRCDGHATNSGQSARPEGQTRQGPRRRDGAGRGQKGQRHGRRRCRRRGRGGRAAQGEETEKGKEKKKKKKKKRGKKRKKKKKKKKKK